MTCGFQQIIPLTATEFTADNVIQLFERAADDGLDIYQATEILRASCNANPSSVISVISDIANRIESKSEVLSAKYMLHSIPWEALDPEQLAKLIPVFNKSAAYDESYGATIHALEYLVGKIDNSQVANCVELTLGVVTPERIRNNLSNQDKSNHLTIDWYSKAMRRIGV